MSSSLEEPWVLALLILASLVVVYRVLAFVVRTWAEGAYEKILNSPKTHCDIDAFVGPDNPPNKVQVCMAHKLRFGSQTANMEPIPLECVDSIHIPGIKVSRKRGTAPISPTARSATPLERVLADEKSPPVVIATIRMGFGHHRLAYSAASWVKECGHTPIFHDLLNVDSPEADLLKNTDDLYSKGSRWATEIGGPIEKIWGSLMLSGNADALRMAAFTSAFLQPLLLAFPKDIPMITTHQLVALTASACGFTNVHNLVVDNHPQWFLTVPNTINLVQGPVNYESFLRMGIRPAELAWAGHWCPTDLVKNIPTDCQRRIQRANQRLATGIEQKPLRILIPVGGAGAQKKFIIGLVRTLSDLVKQGHVQILLNAGDHSHMKEAFLEVLDDCSLDFETIDSTEGVYQFQERLLDPSKEPNKAVTLFAFDEYFPAVATTDILSRVADVLACKPSELAFYCLPKLHIRRVGDHEADSAKRASELGDGTLEARELEDALAYVNMFLDGPDLLVSMNRAIMNNNKIGIYSGCRKAVAMALGEDPKED